MLKRGKLTAGMLVLAVLALGLPGPAAAVSPMRPGSDYIVQEGDWLGKIAQEMLGDGALYPAIVLATNTKAATVNASYATITDPWRIEAGWKLAIPGPAEAQASLSERAIKNTEYLSEWTASGRAPLSDGEYTEDIVPGSASKIRVSLDGHMAFGQTADGQPMAAVIMYTNSGGSGTFRDLAVVVDKEGVLTNVATASLGDRAKIVSVAVQGQEIALDMVTHGPSDPMCCPSQRERRTFAFEGDQLTETSSSIDDGAQSAPKLGLEHTPWKLDSYMAKDGKTVPVLPESQVTLDFAEGQASGKAGCNLYFGPYQSSGDSLTFGPAGLSMMMCAPEALMAQEAAYMAALSKAASFKISGETLQIADAQGAVVASFSALEPMPLTGTIWRLADYNNGKGGVVSALASSEVTAIFSDEGQVSGSAGCNNYTGAYTFENGAVTFGPMATTRKMCGDPAGIMDQESAYLAALAMASKLQIRGDELTLSGADGARVASFIVK